MSAHYFLSVLPHNPPWDIIIITIIIITIIIMNPLDSWNWGSEKWSHLSRVAQWVSDRARRIQTWAVQHLSLWYQSLPISVIVTTISTLPKGFSCVWHQTKQFRKWAPSILPEALWSYCFSIHLLNEKTEVQRGQSPYSRESRNSNSDPVTQSQHCVSSMVDRPLNSHEHLPIQPTNAY